MTADLVDLIAFSIAERCFARQESCWGVRRLPSPEKYAADLREAKARDAKLRKIVATLQSAGIRAWDATDEIAAMLDEEGRS